MGTGFNEDKPVIWNEKFAMLLLFFALAKVTIWLFSEELLRMKDILLSHCIWNLLIGDPPVCTGASHIIPISVLDTLVITTF